MRQDVFPHDKARELCPHGGDCKYAQIPACTIASVYQQCSIYRDRMTQTLNKPQNDHFANEMDKFKGVGR